jgi:hypothetical protein
MDFVPIGMLERWNIGKMGFGCWNVGMLAKFVCLKIIIGLTSFDKPTIPSLQNSKIP